MPAGDLDQLGLGVIVCEHIANGSSLPSEAVREAPIDKLESGWVFFCDQAVSEDSNSAKIWRIDEIVRIDPLIEKIIACDYPCRFRKINADGLWKRCT